MPANGLFMEQGQSRKNPASGPTLLFEGVSAVEMTKAELTEPLSSQLAEKCNNGEIDGNLPGNPCAAVHHPPHLTDIPLPTFAAPLVLTLARAVSYPPSSIDSPFVWA